MATAIEVDGVNTVLGGNVVHRDLRLAVEEGEVLAIVGVSGGGKTTLLREMLGLHRPDSGTIRIFGHPMGACTRQDLKQVQHLRGVLFQQGALFSALSIFDNVALPLRELKYLPETLVRELALRTLALTGIDAVHAPKMPAELSGGMVKRVALARALVMSPSLLFLDEPTSGLDPQSSGEFVRLVHGLRDEMKLTIVMVTHDVETLLALADRVAVLADLHFIAIGTPDQVSRVKHPFVRGFFGGHAAAI